MQVDVDVFERRSGVPDALVALGIEVRIEKLRAGDYAIGDRAVIERKTVRDLHLTDRPAYAQRPQRDPRISAPEQALAAASGVSTVTARRLLEEFGSLIEVLQTSPQELCRVPGVGAKRALAIQQLARSN